MTIVEYDDDVSILEMRLSIRNLFYKRNKLGLIKIWMLMNTCESRQQYLKYHKV